MYSYTLLQHDALPISSPSTAQSASPAPRAQTIRNRIKRRSRLTRHRYPGWLTPGSLQSEAQSRVPIMAERSTFSRKYLAWLLVPALVIVAAVAWFALDPGFRNAAPQEARAPETADEFGRRVRDYLLENPEVLVEAMQRLETRQRAAEADAVESVLAADRKSPRLNSSHSCATRMPSFG